MGKEEGGRARLHHLKRCNIWSSSWGCRRRAKLPPSVISLNAAPAILWGRCYSHCCFGRGGSWDSEGCFDHSFREWCNYDLNTSFPKPSTGGQKRWVDGGYFSEMGCVSGQATRGHSGCPRGWPQNRHASLSSPGKPSLPGTCEPHSLTGTKQDHGKQGCDGTIISPCREQTSSAILPKSCRLGPWRLLPSSRESAREMLVFRAVCFTFKLETYLAIFSPFLLLLLSTPIICALLLWGPLLLSSEGLKLSLSLN